MTSRAAILLVASLLFACRVQGQTVLTTPPIDNRYGKTTVAQVNLPEVGEGSTPTGANVDQVFADNMKNSVLGATPVKVGVDDQKPVLSGRKMLADSPPAASAGQGLSLTGSGVQAGADGVGISTTLYGHGQGSVTVPGGVKDAHIQPHGDETTVTAAGKSVSTGAEVNPDNAGGEGPPLVSTTPGRK